MSHFIRDNYPQLLTYRNEALQKIGTLLIDDLERPPARAFVPTIWYGRECAYPSLALGQLRIAAVGPPFIVAEEAVSKRERVSVLDIGCAAGRFRDYLLLKRPNRVVEYTGVDAAPPRVDFPVYRSLADAPERKFDLILMSETAEHMPAETFVSEYLLRFPALLEPDGVLVVSVPNPLAPAVLQRDVTHVQHYPWYDLYALLRFFFDEVDVVRTHFISSPRRLLSFPMRRFLSYFLEVDWCEGIVLLARGPRTPN